MVIQAPLVRLKSPVPAFYIFEVWGDAKTSDGLRDFRWSTLSAGIGPLLTSLYFAASHSFNAVIYLVYTKRSKIPHSEVLNIVNISRFGSVT
ncbi:uncharacterized protein BO96DRAFT_8351 [Aspergillus niger CBS 101883]|uniref:Uncharacterized protein n=1 Tax=Aspergillus phoenicis ATCC 13157 TaxID=1353007 RepID=A0A370PIT7_ASPPH|nr:uncharacterized protein BO96DRAFT_8351 [Aspergillus niger CBS 101883]PYH62136.1 hypothetical protein BO96DRAFT_8351 [Aspergillus niger CBS 101883]RDK42131.1 hypothetical protein M752DRAFT_24749 [Aspergillus phoenicis ATCC 13157]